MNSEPQEFEADNMSASKSLRAYTIAALSLRFRRPPELYYYNGELTSRALYFNSAVEPRRIVFNKTFADSLSMPEQIAFFARSLAYDNTKQSFAGIRSDVTNTAFISAVAIWLVHISPWLKIGVDIAAMGAYFFFGGLLFTITQRASDKAAIQAAGIDAACSAFCKQFGSENNGKGLEKRLELMRSYDRESAQALRG